MKACADFEQRSDAAVDVGIAFGGFGDAREDLQQRALPSAVAADDADDFAALYFEGNVAQCPEGVQRIDGGLRTEDRRWTIIRHPSSVVRHMSIAAFEETEQARVGD